jgi:hypothetical protein
MAQATQAVLLWRIRFWLVLFIAGLVLSFLTAFPLERELVLLNHFFRVAPVAPKRRWTRTSTAYIGASRAGRNRQRQSRLSISLPDRCALFPSMGGWIDMGFGVFGALPLMLSWHLVRRLKRMS